MKRETVLYEHLEKGDVRCGICGRRCLIPEGGTGWCKTRYNENGTLYLLMYGEVSSLSVNPIEKKPVFHFLPGSRWLSLGTLGCNFRCPGCQNWMIAHWKGGSGRETEYLSAEEAVAKAVRQGCTGISWTFNEPTIWLEYTIDTALLAREAGLYTNYVTNGYISEKAFDLLAPVLDIWRVDIKGFTDDTYKKIGHINEFRKILQTTEKAKRLNIHVEVVTNIIPAYNDSQ